MITGLTTVTMVVVKNKFQLVSCNFLMIIFISVSDYPNTILIQQRLRRFTLAFNQSWTAYKAGFNDIDGTMWIGNEMLHNLTKDGDYQLRVEIQESATSIWHCYLYDQFIVDNETSGYQLHISGYLGPPGEDAFGRRDGQKFTTFDSAKNEESLLFMGGFWHKGRAIAVINGGGASDLFYFSWLFKSGQISLRTSRLLLQQRARQ